MGGVDKKVGVTLRNLKRGGWAKRRDYNYKGGTCDPLRNHVLLTEVTINLCEELQLSVLGMNIN